MRSCPKERKGGGGGWRRGERGRRGEGKRKGGKKQRESRRKRGKNLVGGGLNRALKKLDFFFFLEEGVKQQIVLHLAKACEECV